MKRNRFISGAGLLLAAIFAIAIFADMASAQTPTTGKTTTTPTTPTGPHPIRVFGKVSAISGSSLTLTTGKGDYTVNIGANTWIVVKQNGQATQATATDIQTGQGAMVAGMVTGDAKVIEARIIAQGTMQGNHEGHQGNNKSGKSGKSGGHRERGKAGITEHVAIGTVSAINGNTITLKGEKIAEVTVNTTGNTVVLNNGFSTLSSIKVGDKVQVLGRPEKSATSPTAPTAPGASATPSTPGTKSQLPQSRTIDAWGLRVDNGTTKLVVAHVGAVNGNVLTLKTREHPEGMTVNLDSNTGYKSVSIMALQTSLTSATQSDVKAGNNVIIEGAPSADGKSLNAKAVVILPQRQQKQK